jgi:hypothetical protein
MRKWWIGAALMATVTSLIVARLVFPHGNQDSLQRSLDKNEIDAILKAALSENRNLPEHACVSLPGAELPADVNATSLLTLEGRLRSDVDALIRSNLITVNFHAGKGKPTVRNPAYEAIGPDVHLSHVELTPFGKSFYRYHELEITNGSSDEKDLYMMNLFCARVTYGGVEKFTTPAKNPFDDNPHQVTWVNFLWKPDERTTPWLANHELKESLVFHPEDDGWAREGILLERGDDGRWGLGDRPYIIRW